MDFTGCTPSFQPSIFYIYFAIVRCSSPAQLSVSLLVAWGSICVVTGCRVSQLLNSNQNASSNKKAHFLHFTSLLCFISISAVKYCRCWPDYYHRIWRGSLMCLSKWWGNLQRWSRRADFSSHHGGGYSFIHPWPLPPSWALNGLDIRYHHLHSSRTFPLQETTPQQSTTPRVTESLIGYNSK